MSSAVEVDRSDLVEVFRTLDLLVVSLDRFGSWSSDQSPGNAAAVLMTLHMEMGVFERLANARRVLDSYFDHTIGVDRMDEVERELHDERDYWTAPSS